MNIPVQTLIDEHEQHYQSAKSTEQNPDGGAWPAYPSGKSWDDASGPTGSGKKFYHNIIDRSQVASEPFYVAIITPVIHYCMGGLEVDVNSGCIGADGKAIPGLYAAGEVAGGVHGNNRLGGNSLLDCVVFGRVAGKHCAQYMMGTCVPTSLSELSGAYKVGGGGEVAAGGEAAAGGAPAAAAAAQFSLDDVASHNNKSDCWVVLHDRVLDVTDFLKDHSGGELAILTFAGKDATAEFDMIHPPDVIDKYLDPAKILGMVGAAGASPDAPAASGGADAPLLEKKKKVREPKTQAGEGQLTGWTGACFFCVWAVLKEVCLTIFRQKNITFTNDRP